MLYFDVATEILTLISLQNPYESTTGTNDSLKIRYQNDADTVNFQCEGSDDRLCDFDLKLMQIESEPWEEKHVFDKFLLDYFSLLSFEKMGDWSSHV